jgi:uncharacterized protein (TIGR03089 family)
MYDTAWPGGGRVELSGATTANWVAKTANLLVDGLASPDRIGLLLPLHWHTVVLLLAGAATGTTVVLVAEPTELTGCDAAFVLAEHAEAALDAGVPEVMALSSHPLGLPPPQLPALVAAYASEVPAYADHFGGPRPATARIEVAGQPVKGLPDLPPEARLLTVLGLTDPHGTAVLLGALAAGASLVMLPAGDAAAVAAAERVTMTAGITLPGLTQVA